MLLICKNIKMQVRDILSLNYTYSITKICTLYRNYKIYLLLL